MTNNKTWVKFLKLKDQTFEAFKISKLPLRMRQEEKSKH
jgi:hypothetical protein